MSQPNDNAPGPPPDPLVAAVLRATRGAAAGDCPDADVLALYADHALDTAELAQVTAHLPDCARCQAIVAAYVQASEGALPGGGTEQVAGAAGRATAGGWFSGWRWLVPMASLATVAVVAVWIGRGPADQVAEQARADAGREAQLERPAPSAVARPEADAVPGGPAPDAPSPNQPLRPASQAAEQSAALEAAIAARARANAGAAADALADRRLDPLREAKMKAAAEAAPMANAANAVQAPRAAEMAAERQEAAGGGAPRDSRAAAAPAAAPSLATADAATAAKSGAVGSLKATTMIALTGTVTYRARVALSPGAVIDVRLLDVSRTDAPATTLARSAIVTRGEQVPVPFTLRYDPTTIQPRRRYVVQATITVDGRVTWRTTTPQPVLVDGAPEAAPVDVVVDAIR